MVLLAAIFLVTSGNQGWKSVTFKQKLYDLAIGRDKFEFDLDDPEKYEAKNTVESMINDRTNLGFFPVGRCDWRFVLYESGTTELLYQEREGDKTRTKWSIPVVETKEPSPNTGTIVKYLATLGLGISGTPTKLQQKILDQSGSLIGYGYLNEISGDTSVWLVNANGSQSGLKVFPESMNPKSNINPGARLEPHPWPPITAFEARLLEGKKGWSPSQPD